MSAHKSCHIVLTTINHPAIVQDLYENIHRYGHLDEVKVWIVGDRKTPGSAASLAAEMTRKGLETIYFDIFLQYIERKFSTLFIRLFQSNFFLMEKF